MNTHTKYEKLFEKALNNEMNDSELQIFNNHLTSCAACSEEFKELKNTLAVFRSVKKSEPDTEFMNNFWEILEPKLSVKPESRKAGLFSNALVHFSEWLQNLKYLFQYKLTWKYQFAGAAVLLFTGIIIGRYFLSGTEVPVRHTAAENNVVREAAYPLTETAEYLERSKVLLISMMHFDPSEDDAEIINLPQQQKISKELLVKSAALKDQLKDEQMKNLISDIELILLQISNLELKNGLSAIELIQDGVNSRGIILKINIGEMKKLSEENFETRNTTNTGTKI